ncbi:MAG: DUF6340 family protein [Tannerella sp.]|nr:DUF6340 family protein [Tannerella sp.]
MIVNNSAQQSDSVGHRYIRNMSEDSIMCVSADSTAYIFCISLGEAIAESPVFDDVRICEDTIRRDSLFYQSVPFTQSEADALCEDYGVDALVSLDKIVFYSVVFDTRIRGEMSICSISAVISGEARVFRARRKEVHILPFLDSLEWTVSDEPFYFGYAATDRTPEVQYAMRYLANHTAYKLRTNIVPYWTESRRWYYTNLSSEWKRGSVYAAAGKWEQAALVWEQLLSKTKSWKNQARLSSNLALCNEMKGDFDKAVSYSENSYLILREHVGEDGEETKLQRQYAEILKKRSDGDKTVSSQLREK